MTTVVLGEHPEVAALIDRRRAFGLDRSDELWRGVYHVMPPVSLQHGLLNVELGRILHELATPLGFAVSAAFTLGEPGDYRVPDLGLHRASARVGELGPTGDTYLPTAAMVVEILSPYDSTLEKFDFYGRHAVDEILVADPDDASITIWRYAEHLASYLQSEQSTLLATSSAQLRARITWPD